MNQRHCVPNSKCSRSYRSNARTNIYAVSPKNNDTESKGGGQSHTNIPFPSPSPRPLGNSSPCPENAWLWLKARADRHPLPLADWFREPEARGTQWRPNETSGSACVAGSEASFPSFGNVACRVTPLCQLLLKNKGWWREMVGCSCLGLKLPSPWWWLCGHRRSIHSHN